MSGELEHLRPTLRSSILSTLAYNQRNSREGIRLFEVGKAYIPRPSDSLLERPADLPLERETLVGVVTGPRTAEGWLEGDEQMDFFDAKGILETFLGAAWSRLQCSFEPAEDSHVHVGQVRRHRVVGEDPGGGRGRGARTNPGAV